ncbi:uncharacterized protein LOC118185072 [Stegodyphus dumicola]|uniref:uncharacterized protein LOC118185072 n=1 Tax=Stegodyphus dumicola TaxID=202533 RepID=UPI0015AC783F|nr:uncharacterized protein LOC118185072 [Stegodyphus dumicola]
MMVHKKFSNPTDEDGIAEAFSKTPHSLPCRKRRQVSDEENAAGFKFNFPDPEIDNSSKSPSAVESNGNTSLPAHSSEAKDGKSKHGKRKTSLKNKNEESKTWKDQSAILLKTVYMMGIACFRIAFYILCRAFYYLKNKVGQKKKLTSE